MVVLTRSRVILVAGSLFIVLLFVYLLDTPSGIHAAQQRGTSSSSSSGGSGGTAIPSRSTCITSVDAENRCRDAELMSKMLSWESVIAAGIAGVQAPSSIAASLDRLYWSHCIQDPDQLRMMGDPLCTMLWLRKLLDEPVRSISDLIAVVPKADEIERETGKPQQSGGMKASLSTITAYWKPCTGVTTGNKENYLHEIVSFIIDRVVGFYRTSVVVPRYLTVDQLTELARELQDSDDPDAIAKVNTIFEYCADLSGTEGALVGWANFPVKPLSRRIERQPYVVDLRSINGVELEQLRQTRFNITSNSSAAHVHYALENMQLFMFQILTGYVAKYGHNIYQFRTGVDNEIAGMLFYLDNDRAQWRRPADSAWAINKRNNSMTYLCKFPKTLTERLMLLDASQTDTLGAIVYRIAHRFHTRNDPYFAEQDAKVLNINVRIITYAVYSCIQRYGVENVLIPEPWPTDYNIYQQLEHLYSIVQ